MDSAGMVHTVVSATWTSRNEARAVQALSKPAASWASADCRG